MGRTITPEELTEMKKNPENDGERIALVGKMEIPGNFISIEYGTANEVKLKTPQGKFIDNVPNRFWIKRIELNNAIQSITEFWAKDAFDFFGCIA